jgi:hypothetical protein
MSIKIVCLVFVATLCAIPPLVMAAETNPWTFVQVRDDSCAKCLELRMSADDGPCKACLPPIVGIGDRSCGDWTKHRNLAGAVSNEYASWLHGFLSGYSWFASDPEKKFFFHYDESSLLDAIDRDCAATPKRSIAQAVVLFLGKIPKPPVK